MTLRVVHPQLQFIMHMDTWVEGEQLLSQFFRCIPDRQWLFSYGRIPLDLILPMRMWEV
jgi:transcription factor 1